MADVREIDRDSIGAALGRHPLCIGFWEPSSPADIQGIERFQEWVEESEPRVRV